MEGIINKIIKLFIISIFWLAGNALNIAFAEGPELIINEVCWAGSSSSTADEWIELKNVSSNTINVRGWEISHAASSGKSLYLPNDKDYNIAPGQYFLIANYSMDNERSSLAVSPDVVDTGISLLNSANGNLVLKDANAKIFDEVKGGAWPAGSSEAKASMERIDSTSGLDSRNWQTSSQQINLKSEISDQGTPKTENSKVTFTKPDIADKNILEYLNLDNAVAITVKVYNIVDGDTIDVLLNNSSQRVRLIGIDAPESKSSSAFNIDEPYFQEAKDFATDELLNQDVVLLINYDNTLRYDKYDRLLGIIVVNNQLFNIDMINHGLARTYYLDNSLLRADSWSTSEQDAKNNYLGIWSGLSENCIKINEFMPNPSGEDKTNEWIELTNVCDKQINLKNWFIDDNEGGSDPFLIKNDVFINNNEFVLFFSGDSNVILNNSNDRVRLFLPNLSMANEIIYNTDAKENMSYSFIDGQWQWTNNPTPGTSNTLPDTNNQNIDEYQPITNLSQLKKLPKNSKVHVTGIVNVAPNILGKQYFYIEDNTGGVQIFYSEADFTQLAIGDRVSVHGELSDTPYLRVKIDDKNNIKIYDKQQINVSAVDENNYTLYEGRLIKIKGVVKNKTGKIIYLNVNNSFIKIQLKNNVKAPPLKVGNTVEIAGILSVNSDNEYAILPRSVDDFAVLSLANLQQETNEYLEITSRDQMDNLKTGTKVKLIGNVSCAPTMIDDKYFYITNKDFGVQIYNSKKDFPNLNINDQVEVFGKLSKVKGRIIIAKSNDVRILSSDNQITVENVLNDTIDKYYQRLVYIDGVVTAKKGNTFIVNNNNSYPIYLKNKIKKNKNIKVGDYLKIHGIVENYSGVLKITVRSNNDIVVLPQLKSSKSQVAKINTNKSVIKLTKSYHQPEKTHKYLEEISNNHYNNCTINNILLSVFFASFILIIFIRTQYYATTLYYKKIK